MNSRVKERKPRIHDLTHETPVISPTLQAVLDYEPPIDKPNRRSRKPSQTGILPRIFLKENKTRQLDSPSFDSPKQFKWSIDSESEERLEIDSFRDEVSDFSGSPATYDLLTRSPLHEKKRKKPCISDFNILKPIS